MFEQLSKLELKVNFTPRERKYFDKLRDELEAIVGGVSIEKLTKPSDAKQAGRIRKKLEEMLTFLQDREMRVEWLREEFLSWVREFHLEGQLTDEWINEHMDFSGDNIVCNGNLKLYQPDITYFPDKLTINGDLVLDQAKKLVKFPDDVKVTGNLELFCAESLTSLPENLSVTGCLDLSGCKSLVHLPPGLHVSGDIKLTMCSSLKTIGAGSVIGGSFYALSCPKLNSLPNDFQVGGKYVVIAASSLRLWLKAVQLQKRGQIKGLINRR